MSPAAPDMLCRPDAPAAPDTAGRTERRARAAHPGVASRIRPAAGPPRPDPFAGRALTTSARRARRLARDVHDGQPARYGGPLIEHVERVAAAVPESARAVAFVHDVCERSGVWPGEVAQQLGLDHDEREALVLLTKQGREPLVRQVRRVLREPPGPSSELALLVLRADVADHAAHAPDGSETYARVLGILDAAASGLR